MTLIGPLFWFLVATGLLVAWHEFGHYWVARRCGVRVLRFSIGFGKPIYTRHGRDGTEYCVGAIPLGGYVRMLDESVDEVPPAEREGAFNRKTLAQRSAIVLAGPLANLLMAVGFFWLMFVVGVPDHQPVLGQTRDLVARAGLAEGDRILSVDGVPVAGWTDAIIALIPRLYARQPVTLTVARPGRSLPERFVVPLDQLSRDLPDEQLFVAAGFGSYAARPLAVIGGVGPGTPAERAGLAVGDRIVALDGQPVERFDELRQMLVERAEASGGKVTLSILRQGLRLSREVTAEPVPQRDGSRLWRIGVEAETYRTTVRHGPLAAVPQALQQTWTVTVSTFSVLYRMVVGEASLKNVSGPVTIAQVTHQAAGTSAADLLRILAIISLSLGILNLLPIPLLDGGRLVYFACEAVRGRPLAEATQLAGHYVGAVLVLGLMVLALYNDLSRQFGLG